MESTSVAPAARAASAVPSSLPPSTTTVSLASGSARSARSRRGSRAASFSAGITTEIKFPSRRRPAPAGGGPPKRRRPSRDPAGFRRVPRRVVPGGEARPGKGWRMRVADVMSRHVEFVEADAPVKEAAELMGELDVGALPVGAPERLEGVLTDRDILYRVVARGLDCAAVRVRDVLTTPVLSCRPEDDLRAAVHLGRERSMDEDIGFGLRQLVDIAARALSPSVNGPTTAVQVWSSCTVCCADWPPAP